METISYKDFEKLDIRIGTIKEAKALNKEIGFKV